MKALFSKFTRHKAHNSSQDFVQNHNSNSPNILKEKLVLPPLPKWPPQHSKSDASKPLPSPVEPAPQRALSSTTTTATTSISDAPLDSSIQDKKVAFISPSHTPVPPSDTPTPQPRPSEQSLSRSNISRASGKFNSATTATTTSTPVPPAVPAVARPFTPRQFSNDTPSMRSGSPYSQSANSSRILAAPSWSATAQEDLVCNLGPRERTRQEVLWEIVASEERYVAELIKMKETFIDPLLHPFSAVTNAPPALRETTASPAYLPAEDIFNRQTSPTQSLDNLPIASRFLSSPPPGSHSGMPVINDDSSGDESNHGRQWASKALSDEGHGNTNGHPRSPYRGNAGSGRTKSGPNPVPFPSRSRQSLPPPRREDNYVTSTASLGVHSGTAVLGQDSSRKSTATPTSRVLRKLRRSNAHENTPTPESVPEGSVPPHLLPVDLKKCLEVIESGILNGHTTLAQGLRKRYEEQYPLVRSLADIFVANSHILHEYATYVLHLEQALMQVDNALMSAIDSKSRPPKGSSQDWVKISAQLQRLEENAAEKAETGLAISLSKPFQRLLKYPLLFQNLLFHTDPSTYEYESTLQMVAEVESIVRSIEDEKIQKEERDRTRDAFARIDGLEREKALAVPKASRVLIEEKPLNPSLYSPASSPGTTKASNGVRGKTSFKRFSEVLQPGGGSTSIGKKKDVWLVVFNDVVLRCQRTGVTTLPLATGLNSRTNSMPELQGRTKYATTGRRAPQVKARNLYKYLSIESWTIGDALGKTEGGIVNIAEISRLRETPPNATPEPTPEEEVDSDDSDRKSKMSFSYWGADKVTVQKTTVKKRVPLRGGRRGSPLGTAAYGRESSANAKFGTRLVTEDSPARAAIRPSSRKHHSPSQSASVARRAAVPSEDGTPIKATTPKPAWDSSTRTKPLVRGTRTVSQSTTTRQTDISAHKSSIAPSEDSGVGMYRQIMAQNPTFEGDQ